MCRHPQLSNHLMAHLRASHQVDKHPCTHPKASPNPSHPQMARYRLGQAAYPVSLARYHLVLALVRLHLAPTHLVHTTAQTRMPYQRRSMT